MEEPVAGAGQRRFKPGDRVHWANEQGVDLGVRTVLTLDEPEKFGHRYYITPTDTPWMYVREKNLAPTGEENYQEFGTF